jgi:hypothetical protein
MLRPTGRENADVFEGWMLQTTAGVLVVKMERES